MNLKYLAVILLYTIPSLPAVAAEMPARQFYWPGAVVNISKGWLYSEFDSDTPPSAQNAVWVAVDLPHTWNAEDAYRTKDYRRDASWYSKEISVTDRSKRHFIRFEAAAQQARVYVDGKEIETHIGGYSAFTVEITQALRDDGKAKVQVWVSNKHNELIPPLSADFTFFGGLYRDVTLLSTGENCFSRTERGGPGLHWRTPGVSNESASLKTWVTVDKAGIDQTVRFSLIDPAGNLVKTVSASARAGRVEAEFPSIPRPTLWTPELPELYHLQAQLLESGTVLDTVQVPCAFRWFGFDREKGFFLNGNHYFLKGMNRHQDWKGLGNALPDEKHYQDICLMKELGVNWLRLAHYQQNDYLLQLCDQMGILVWEEIPHVNECTADEAYFRNCESMMKDLVLQHDIHPSIVLWGCGNEFLMRKREDKNRISDNAKLVGRLHKIAKTLDPDRYTVIAGHRDPNYYKAGGNIVDVVGFNLYPGWYGNSPASAIGSTMDQYYKVIKDKPMLVSEWGAGSDVRIHTETPKSQDFSEEYQCHYIEEYLDAFEKAPFLCGVNYWNYADFGSASRGDSIPCVNQKGLLTLDRTKKDAFYLVKSRWSEEPVCYLVSPSWTKRSGVARKSFRVYSNAKAVELFHNGTSLGKKPAAFKWVVNLRKGMNTLLAKAQVNGKAIEHGYDIEFTQTGGSSSHAIFVNGKESVDAGTLLDGKRSPHFAHEGSVEILLKLIKPIASDGIEIDFYKGTERMYNLDLEISGDGETWQSVFSGKVPESGAPVSFPFKGQVVSQVRLKGRGNSSNDWNAYHEITIRIDKNAKKLIYETVE